MIMGHWEERIPHPTTATSKPGVKRVRSWAVMLRGAAAYSRAQTFIPSFGPREIQVHILHLPFTANLITMRNRQLRNTLQHQELKLSKLWQLYLSNQLGNNHKSFRREGLFFSVISLQFGILHFPRCLHPAQVSVVIASLQALAKEILARADPIHTLWNFCPSTAAAILFTILFALVTLAHLGQAILYRKTYCWVIVGSGLVQTVNYIFRIVSINNPNTLWPYAAWFVLILVTTSRSEDCFLM